MVAPVFVDTSEGKALIADSLKPPPNPSNVDNENESNKEFEPNKELTKEEPTVEEEKSEKKVKRETKVESKRGKAIKLHIQNENVSHR